MTTTPHDPDRLISVLHHPLVASAELSAFRSKIRRETGWSERHLDRVLNEYRRFAYLATDPASEGRCAPSKAVDVVWHAHLQFTNSYWNDFSVALGRPFHHHPAGEGDREKEWFDATARQYRLTFGEPPEDIWGFGGQLPLPAAPVSGEPTPRRSLRWPVFVFCGLVTAAAPHVLAYEFTGPNFLAFYVSVLVVAAVLSLSIRAYRARHAPPLAHIDLEAREIGYLFHQQFGVRQVALAAMVADGSLVSDGTSLRAAGTRPTDPTAAVWERAQRQPIKVVEARHIKEWRGLDRDVRNRLLQHGVVSPMVLREAAGWITLLPPFWLGLLGVARAMLGVHRGRTIGFLVMLLGVTIGITLALLTPIRTVGQKALREQLRKHTPSKVEGESVDAMLRTVAVHGPKVDASPASGFEPALFVLMAASVTSDSGSSSSASCGGGGCGGGGCGCGG